MILFTLFIETASKKSQIGDVFLVRSCLRIPGEAIGDGSEVKTRLLFSRSHPPQADEGKKELPYWLSMCCQGLSEAFLNNFTVRQPNLVRHHLKIDGCF